MSRRVPLLWLPRLLFRFAFGVSAFLVLLVVLGPFLDNATVSRQSWSRVLSVFAGDRTLRRTAIASALGLMVTACVFFRTPNAPRRVPPKNRRLPPPPSIAGA